MRQRSFSMTVSASLEACLVAVLMVTVGGADGVETEEAAAGCAGTVWFCGCGCGAGGCGMYFFSSGWKIMRTTKVRRKTRRRRRSAPGSCCGFLNSAKVYLSYLGGVSLNPNARASIEARKACPASDLRFPRLCPPLNWFHPESQFSATARLLYHRVVAGAGERMTAEEAGEGHPSAAQGAVALDGLHGIFGAGRHVAAG